SRRRPGYCGSLEPLASASSPPQPSELGLRGQEVLRGASRSHSSVPQRGGGSSITRQSDASWPHTPVLQPAAETDVGPRLPRAASNLKEPDRQGNIGDGPASTTRVLRRSRREEAAEAAPAA